MTHPAIEVTKRHLVDALECLMTGNDWSVDVRAALRAIEEAERGARGPFCIEYEERDGHRLMIRDAAGEERRWLLLPWPGEERK